MNEQEIKQWRIRQMVYDAYDDSARTINRRYYSFHKTCVNNSINLIKLGLDYYEKINKKINIQQHVLTSVCECNRTDVLQYLIYLCKHNYNKIDSSYLHSRIRDYMRGQQFSKNIYRIIFLTKYEYCILNSTNTFIINNNKTYKSSDFNYSVDYIIYFVNR